MAAYNTFLVMKTKGVPLLVTSSARKARQLLEPGVRIEVWSSNERKLTIYTKTEYLLGAYVTAEKEYIRQKQAAAEQRNRKRRRKT